MKFTKLFLGLFLCFSFLACNKNTINVAPTSLPADLNYLVGDWKVVDFYHSTFAGIDTTKPAYFDALSFSQTKLTVYRNGQQIGKRKFHFSKDDHSGLYRLNLAGKECRLTAEIDHYIFRQQDTLLLNSTIVDGGTSYRLVKR